jgi:hypothetical protein
MKITAMDTNKRLAEITDTLKKEFSEPANQTEKFVKRTPRSDKLDDLQEKLYEARIILQIMKDILIDYGRKAIDEFEDEMGNTPNKNRYIEKLQNYIIKEIPGRVQNAMRARVR